MLSFLHRVVVGGVLVSQLSAAGAASLEVGERFPDLLLPRLEDGRPGSIADYRGEKLLLHVFASW